MPFFSKLFGAAKPAPTKGAAQLHKDFRITPEPIPEDGGFRVAAVIEKDVAGQSKSHLMVRADTATTLEEAQEISLFKAQIFIDQMGEKIFDS